MGHKSDKHVICFGEVLWDMLPEGARLGGAPLNVCYHLGRQGVGSQMISQVGKDENGRLLLAEMQKLGVDVGFCEETDAFPTSTVEVHLLGDGKIDYEIVADVAWDHIVYKETVADAVAAADVFVYGSLAARSSGSRATLLSYLERARWTVMDINLRAPFYSKESVFELISKCQTLKINDDELELVGDWLGVKGEEAVLGEIGNHFTNVKEIMLTKGARGALYYSKTLIYKVPAYTIKVQDTIGSGDSFLAAFLAHRLQGNSVQNAMDQAALLSAFVATRAGACPVYASEDIVNFKNTHSNEN